MFEMNKLSTRHLRMMNALEETLREIARLFQPYVSIFIRFYNLPPSPPLPLYIPSRYCKELKFTQQPRPNSLSRILNFQDPSFPSFYPLARDISRLILHIIFIEPGIERTSRKMADIRITSITLAKEEKGRGRKGIPSGGTLLSTLHGVRLMLPRSYSRGVVPLLANNNTR